MAFRTEVIYRAIAGVVTLALVVTQYALLVSGKSMADAGSASVRFFSFFTILTNLIAAVALLVPVAAPSSGAAGFLTRPAVRTAITGYMIMVGVVYYLLLAGLSQRGGLPLLIEHMLHALTPPLFLLDWLLFVDKRRLDWRLGLRSLGYPLAYIAYTLAHGAATGWYPYPFLDVAEIGYTRVAANVAALVAVYVVLTAALAALGQRLAGRALP
jgi:hypothetical protein